MIIIWKPSVNRENCSSASACCFRDENDCLRANERMMHCRWETFVVGARAPVIYELSNMCFVVLVSEKTNKLLIIVRSFVCCFIVLRWQTRHNKNVSTPSEGVRFTWTSANANINKLGRRPPPWNPYVSLSVIIRPLSDLKAHVSRRSIVFAFRSCDNCFTGGARRDIRRSDFFFLSRTD